MCSLLILTDFPWNLHTFEMKLLISNQQPPANWTPLWTGLLAPLTACLISHVKWMQSLESISTYSSCTGESCSNRKHSWRHYSVWQYILMLFSLRNWNTSLGFSVCTPSLMSICFVLSRHNFNTSNIWIGIKTDDFSVSVQQAQWPVHNVSSYYRYIQGWRLG